MDNNSRPPLAALLARDDEIARLEQRLSIVTMQRDMARTELAELRERIRERDGRRRDAVAALCEALGLPPR